ncbi:MAG: hypothetical protein ABMB14_10620 [Myxococcota bacterium]
MRTFLAIAVAAGCHKNPDPPPPGDLTDTGWFTTSTATVDPDHCPDRFVSSVPADGADDWYWRTRPTVFTETTDHDAYDVWLQTATGERLDTTLVWDELGLKATVEWDGYLRANTDYVLGYEDCASLHTAAFHTSSLGAPLLDPPGSLQGNTYLLDFVGANWEPAALSGVMSLYFTTPVLLGIQLATEDQIDLLGGPGVADDFGGVAQDVTSPTWDFPLADFSGAPFLNAAVDRVSLKYGGVASAIEIPIEDFLFQGTFSADGTILGGGVLSGLGDSRNLGEVLNQPDNPGAMCELAGSVGVVCQPCRDGQPYCLDLRATGLAGELIPGLALVEIGG